MWPNLYFPKGDIKYDKLDYRIINLVALLEELQGARFSGYVEILALHEHGLIIFHSGRIHQCYYEGTDDLQLDPPGILEHFLHNEKKERDSVINAVELNPRLVEALSALESRPAMQRELETAFLEMDKLLETLSRKRFTGTLRFYRIRNNTRLGNILLKMKKITQDQLKEAIRFQMSGDGSLRLGDALVKIGALQPADLQDALARQTHTRRGSDLEYALTLFSAGELMGGYTLAGKSMTSSRQDILNWANTPEMLMDIIEGTLPSVITLPKASMAKELETLLEKQGAGPAPAPDASPAPSEPVQGGDMSQETLNLKSDDLIIEISPYEDDRKTEPVPAEAATPPTEPVRREARVDAQAAPTNAETGPVPSPEPEAAPPEPPVPGNPPLVEESAPVVKAEPEPAQVEIPASEEAPPALETERVTEPPTAKLEASEVETVPNGIEEAQEPGAPGSLESGLPPSSVEELASPALDADIPIELHGLEFIAAIMDKYLGFLGRALLAREQNLFAGRGLELSNAQVRALVQRLQPRIDYLIGPTRSRSLMQIVMDNLGD